ncbi:MAG: major capsid protein [Desulfobulbus sp.]|nr:major capsid protein [Desulfobulbus sp.]
MRGRIEATNRYHRIGAITGKVFDADGSTVLLDTHDRFGIEPQYVDMALGTGGTDVAQKIRDAMRKSEDAVAGTGVISGWLAVCGRGFYDAFVAHDKVTKAFDRWNDGQFLRDDLRKGFTFQNVVWKEFYGKVGAIKFIGNDDAYLVPMGVSDLFISRFAPADYMETVNTIGLPYYAKQEPMRFGRGVELEAQSNPLNLCTRPRAVIRLYKTAKP